MHAGTLKYQIIRDLRYILSSCLQMSETCVEEFNNSNNILNRWKNYFSWILNVLNVNGIKQIEVHTAKPFVPVVLRFKMLLQS